MITAYLLINVESVNPVLVAEELILCEEVDNVHQIVGEYDLIARVTAKDVIHLREHVLKDIEHIKGVVKITSLVVED